MIEISLQSTATPAKTGTKSLRATVPEGIVAFFDLKDGDKLEWQMEFRNGKRISIVSKVSKKKSANKP